MLHGLLGPNSRVSQSLGLGAGEFPFSSWVTLKLIWEALGWSVGCELDELEKNGFLLKLDSYHNIDGSCCCYFVY